MGCYIDTSGSVGQQEMTACLTEVVTMAKLCNPAKLYVVYWSDGIEREEVYLPEQYDSILTLTKPTGGGGTTVEECAVHAQKADIACAIILTDGYIYGPWGDWGDVPTLWCITTSKLAPFGKTVKLAI
jgi:predicted metal-dependent peptidase